CKSGIQVGAHGLRQCRLSLLEGPTEPRLYQTSTPFGVATFTGALFCTDLSADFLATNLREGN
ncbi:MAG: hypothetical protein ACREBC_18895, partial [Pyrinomonadaceae bacterium]